MINTIVHDTLMNIIILTLITIVTILSIIRFLEFRVLNLPILETGFRLTD